MVEANCGKIKNSWKGVNLIMGKVKQPTKIINALKFGEFSFSSPSEISEAINNDFSNVGQSLANEIPPSNLGFSKYVHPVPHTFTLTGITNNTVLKLINSLPLNKASGLDGISCRLLREVAPIVASSLTYTST